MREMIKWYVILKGNIIHWNEREKEKNRWEMSPIQVNYLRQVNFDSSDLPVYYSYHQYLKELSMGLWLG